MPSQMANPPLVGMGVAWIFRVARPIDQSPPRSPAPHGKRRRPTDDQARNRAAEDQPRHPLGFLSQFGGSGLPGTRVKNC